MRVSSKGLDLIKRFEGCRLEVYLCPAGKRTAGYGTTGHGVAEMPLGAPITQEQADAWLAEDVAEFAQAVEKAVKVPVTQNEFDALTSFAYNVGVEAFEHSTLLKKLNERDRAGAAAEFLRWIHAGGRELSGLVKRRAAERELFLAPDTENEDVAELRRLLDSVERSIWTIINAQTAELKRLSDELEALRGKEK
jgi:lysozyme